ncbi:hypothetical protein Daus18300_012083 [Diaporthe australafricana]|uniref:Uncharacterized protein n=1 Tax=Diaporthe australafricana TaxID=127596 RepID=A0ABR3W417_9PEZI
MHTPSLFSVAILLSPVLAGGVPGPDDSPPPKLEPTKLENFNWTNPFSSPKLANFDAACESQRKFEASEYQLHDLQLPEPKGLQPFGEALKEFFGGREYPGGWDGIDAHRYERNLLKMEYADVPVKVREWIEEEERSEGPGKGLFAVYQKPADGETVKKVAKLPKAADHLRPLDKKRTVIFAPGAVYETLPLWVAEGSDCEDTLTDLTKYGPKLKDGGVVAWPTDFTTPKRSSQERNMEFTIKAQVLSAKARTPLDTEGQEAVKADSKDEL